MNVPFVDLKAQYLSIKDRIDGAVSAVINETAFIGGKYVEKFEREFASLYGVEHCVSVANGTDSLYIIMKMLGIGPGDEVITVANSWISSSETITQTGATPVFVDIDPRYYTIDVTKIEAAITPKTKAIMPVHLYGQMCDMEQISLLSEKYGLKVIEDCAQSHFSAFQGRRAGSFGVAGSFSFYPGKNLGAYGDAGCIITNEIELATKCRMYARHGALKKHEHQMEGINSRLDGLQAAILSEKLPFILEWTEARIKNADYYDQLLKNNAAVTIPQRREGSKHSFHLYVIKHDKRDELASYLKLHGVETAVHYPVALPNMKAYEHLKYTPEDFPVATKNQHGILSLPMYPELQTSQVEYIAELINKFG